MGVLVGRELRGSRWVQSEEGEECEGGREGGGEEEKSGFEGKSDNPPLKRWGIHI